MAYFDLTGPTADTGKGSSWSTTSGLFTGLIIEFLAYRRFSSRHVGILQERMAERQLIQFSVER
jgi:hypothetical protein